MYQPRVLLLTTLILLSASHLLAQPPRLQENQSGQPAVCNDGTIPFFVARAHRHAKDVLFGGGQWEVWGWFTVDPGKCTAIGPWVRFESGGWLGSGDSVTLLAFAFFDAKGVLRGVKVQPGDSGWFYPIYPADQQICVKTGEFQYTRESLEQKDLARVCDRAAAGFMLVPASYIYKGSVRVVTVFDEPDNRPDYVHVKIGSDGRAITSGHTIGSAGISQGSIDGGGSQSSGDGNSSLCGKVSCLDQIVQGLNQAAKENEAKRSAANNPPPPRVASIPPGSVPPTSLRWVRTDIPAIIKASETGFASYKTGDVKLEQGLRMWDSGVKPAAARGCWVVQGTTSTTLSCALSVRGDLNQLRSYYNELTQEVAAALPREWTGQNAPPFGGGLPNQGYRSSSGAHLEVFISRIEAEARYEVNFQLVSAH